MDQGRLARLTEAQRACLRVMARGLEVKEIAVELGLTPAAVTERLRAARATLDVSSSREAARMVAREEGLGTYIRHGDMPNGVPASDGITAGTGASSIGPDANDAGVTVADSGVPYDPALPPSPVSRGGGGPAAGRFGKVNWQRVVLCVGGTLLLAAVVIVFAAVLTDVSRWLAEPAH